MWVREEKVLAQVEEVLKKLACDEETLAYINGYLREIEENERGFIRRQISEWQKQQAKLQNRLDTLMDLLLDGMIEREEFEAKKSKIRRIKMIWSSKYPAPAPAMMRLRMRC